MQVLILRLEGPRLDLDVNRDRLHLAVEHPYEMTIPTGPYPATGILRGNRVIRLGHLDVTVPVHRPSAFLKAGESTGRQWRQLRLFLLEEQVNLLAGGAVDAGVGDPPFPVAEVLILLGQADERVALQGIVLDVIDPLFHLALVPRHPRLGRQNHRPVVLTEGLDFRVHLRIVPVRPTDGRLEIVDHGRLGNPAKGPEGVLQAAEEVLGRLMVNHLAVRLSRETQDDPEDITAATFAVRPQNRRPDAEVHLCLLTQQHLQPAERQRLTLTQTLEEPTNAGVAGRETMPLHQVLVDPLAGQSLPELCLNHRPKRLTEALRTGTLVRQWGLRRRGPGDRVHRWLRPGDRVRGRF